MVVVLPPFRAECSVFDESCGVHYMFPGCRATPLALHAWKEVFVPLGLKSCSRQEAVKFA